MEQGARTLAIVGTIAVAAALVATGSAASGRVRLQVVAHDGTVVAYGTHFRCHSSCTLSTRRREPVILEARPTRLFSFDHWAGACHGSATTCVLSLASAARAQAVFTRDTGAVLLTVGGAGSVNVVDGQEDSCGPSSNGCDIVLPTPTTIELDAVANTGASFGGWGGDCAGTTGVVCSLTVPSSGRMVSAAFTTTPAGSGDQQELRVETLSDSVTSSLPDFSCQEESTCPTSVASGTLVVLQAAPEGLPSMSPWSGACVGFGYSCQLVVDGSTEVMAPDLHPPYKPPLKYLNIGVAGGGVVTGGSGGRCAATLGAANCEFKYSPSQKVARIAAVHTRGYVFKAWINDFGDCSPAKRPTCTVQLGESGSIEATAKFVRSP